MNKDLVVLGGSDLQFLNLLSARIKEAFPDKEIYTSNDAYDVYYKSYKEHPNLIVLEKIFPQWDWDGYMICKLLKRDSRFMDLKFVLIADRRDKDMESIIEDPSVDKVLFKVDGLDVIFEEIRRLI
jgi:CheY-like chemotaxis protein